MPILSILSSKREKIGICIYQHIDDSIKLVGVSSYLEEEQGGASRAEYGKALLKNIAIELMPISELSTIAKTL